MRLEDYKLVFVTASLIGVLLCATPTLSALLSLPSGEQFSEIWLLGPERLAENYPFNIRVGQKCQVYVGVGNKMGSSAYYVVYVKLRNQTDLLPNTATGTASPFQPIFEYRVFVQDGEIWESPLTFSVSDASVFENQAVIQQITVNDIACNVDKPAGWNATTNMFYYQLFLELWMYDAESGSVNFNSRFVSLSLNFTENA